MEKITRSRTAISQKEKQFALTVGRYIVAALLVLAVLAVARPGSMHAQTQSPPNYRIVAFSLGTSPAAVKIGDLDGDGLNDIAVVTLQGSLELFFNNGAGGFQRVSLNGPWPANSHTLDVDIGDLNRDGRNDIAVACSTQRGAISVLLNQGNRTFAAPVNYDVCNSSIGVAIGDLNRDGANDLADISQCSKAGILLNDGHGRFALNGTYGTGNASKSIVLADFNGDGAKDIAYVNQEVGDGSITTLLNNGNATFRAPGWVWAGDLPDDVTVGDFDGNGATDLAIANAYWGEIFIMFNEGAGNFSAGYSEIYADTPSSIVAGDFNGDGLTDIATASQTTSRLALFINRGNYNFASPISYNVGQTPVDMAVGNLDGDGLPDLVVANQGSGSITILFSTGGTPPPPPPPPPITLTVSTRTTSQARLVDLQWNNVTSSRVDIYRNGSKIVNVPNTGSYTDQFNKRTRGTFKYKVCVAGAQQCSSEATISF